MPMYKYYFEILKINMDCNIKVLPINKLTFTNILPLKISINFNLLQFPFVNISSTHYTIFPLLQFFSSTLALLESRNVQMRNENP